MTQPPAGEPSTPSGSGPSGWRHSIRRNRTADVAYRTGVFVFGWLIVLAGLAMLFLPGPGWAAIFVGLAVLATEYAWAHRLLGSAKERAQRAKERAMDPARRRQMTVLGIAVALAAAGVAYWYVASYGLTLDGPRAWF